MLASATWIGASGQNQCYALAYDGAYIYAGLYTSPARVIKIDRMTMTTVGVWTGVPGTPGYPGSITAVPLPMMALISMLGFTTGRRNRGRW
jgi:hypothetical protein